MKLAYSLAVVAALFGAPALATAGEDCGACCEGKATKIARLTTEDLAKIVAEKKATIIDVNPADRYAKSHVPGAINVANWKDLSEKDLPADKSAMIVFYCAAEKCGASEAAAKKAMKLGYTNVAVYKPGIAGWEEAKQPVETGGPKATS